MRVMDGNDRDKRSWVMKRISNTRVAASLEGLRAAACSSPFTVHSHCTVKPLFRPFPRLTWNLSLRTVSLLQTHRLIQPLYKYSSLLYHNSPYLDSTSGEEVTISHPHWRSYA